MVKAFLVILCCATALLVAAATVHSRELVRTAASDVGSVVPTVSAQRPFAVFIGDSYTAGTGASSESARFVTLIAHHENWAFKNFGEGGTGYIAVAQLGEGACGALECDAYGSRIAAVADLHPDIVVVSGGRNDLSKPYPGLQRAVGDFFRHLRAALPAAKIYVTSPIWGAERPPARLLQLRIWVRESARSVGAAYLDLDDPLMGSPELITADGVHPNDAGHGVIAEAVERAIDRG